MCSSIRFERWSPPALPVTIALMLMVAFAAGCSTGNDLFYRWNDPAAEKQALAPALTGIGDVSMRVTTDSSQSQAFFNQGLRLVYAYNHHEALRAFREAARLDPGNAMAYWGQALALGPNLNRPMQAEAIPEAHAAIQRALELRRRVTTRERDFILALAQRYSADPQADRALLNEAYASAMAGLSARYPGDDDAATLYASALMNQSPWGYWNLDGTPASPRTATILATLEGVIARSPAHTGALHYYIHAVEAAHPERGVAAADLLRGLTPGAGHLLHMPAHIYMRVGRYADAYEVNVDATGADQRYIAQCRAQGMYPLHYFPHNRHFLAWAAAWQGRSQAALSAARDTAAHALEQNAGTEWALHQVFTSLPLDVLVRFSQWERVLAEPEPPEGLRYHRGFRHYARGLAFVARGDDIGAAAELAALDALLNDYQTDDGHAGFSRSRDLLTIARSVLLGQRASAAGDHVAAISHFEHAVALEDVQPYNEPPAWFTPTRHYLGQALLAARQPHRAEQVYRADLVRYPENGYALAGLSRALGEQGRAVEAAEAGRRFRRAWQAADTQLAASLAGPVGRRADDLS